VVISKSQLVTSDERTAAKRAVAAVSLDVPVVDDLDGTVASTLLGLGTRRGHDATAVPPPTLLDLHRTEVHPLPRPTTGTALSDLLEGLPDDVVRAKGIAEGPDGSRLLLQVVGRRRRITLLPRSEDQEPTDLVVIRF
jgi:G3E family GTPase